MSRLIVVTEPHKEEVLAAVRVSVNPNNIFLSRRVIEDEIAGSPDKYPLLSQSSQSFRRQIITKVMKRHFEFWGGTEVKKRSNFVWIVGQPEVMGHA